MAKLLRLVLVASVVAGLFAFTGLTAAPAAASAQYPLRLTLFEAPGTNVLAGRLENVDPSLAFVVVTVTFYDGTSRSINVDASTNWSFSFGVIPPDGFVGLSVTEVPIPQPQPIAGSWDYGYRYGFYYAYPFDDVAWGAFPGYSWPVGYGWGYYPFGYYAYANHLRYNYDLPFYWTYPALYRTPSYVYYGVCGAPNTYIAPSYAYTAFGTLYQPTYVAAAPAVTIGVPYAVTYADPAPAQPAAPVKVDPAPAQTTSSAPANGGRLPVVIPANTASNATSGGAALPNGQTVQTGGAPANVQSNPVTPNTVNRTPQLPVTIPANNAAANDAGQAGVVNKTPAGNTAPPNTVNRTPQSLPVTIPANNAGQSGAQQNVVNKAPLSNPVTTPATNNVVNNTSSPVVNRTPQTPAPQISAPKAGGSSTQYVPPTTNGGSGPITKPVNTGRPAR